VAEQETAELGDAELRPHEPGEFDRDTAVTLLEETDAKRRFAAVVSPGWRAGRGPHGGYLAAMLLRALSESVAEPARSPRSLTIHYARAPETGPVSIETTLERVGRSLSTVSARMEQDGRLMALVLGAFSKPWSGPEMSDIEMPQVSPAEPTREAGSLIKHGAPPFTRHIVLQPRLGGMPFSAAEQPMELGGWLGLAEPRPVDALALAFFADALIPAPFMRMPSPSPAPTIDLTIHFRASMPRQPDPDPNELVLARIRGGLIHEGFFEEDGLIWAADGTLLAQSRQLAILLPG
jgi:acyl-coenzyme A thioesterase PaaI-like protein